MSDIIHYTQCPVCNSAEIKKVLTARDYTVSQENFAILECNHCTLRFTQDVPSQNAIASYYKSENYISHTDTSKGLVNQLYKSVRKRTLVQKRKLIEEVTGRATGNLLDVGAGTGSFLNEMKQNNWQVTGLEPDADARAVAKTLHGIDLRESGNLFALTENSFDAITMWHVLEHVHSLQEYIAQLKKLLTANGRLIIAVPNYTSSDAASYGEYWAAYDVPRHLYHFSPKAMEMLMEKHGLKLIACKPMWFDSFYVSRLGSKYRNGNTNWIGAGCTGFVSNLKAMMNVRKCSSVIYVIKK